MKKRYLFAGILAGMLAPFKMAITPLYLTQEEEAQQKALLQQVQEKLEAATAKAKEGLASKQEIEALKAELAELKKATDFKDSEAFKAADAEITRLATELRKLQEGGSQTKKGDTFFAQVKEQLIAQKETLEAIKAGDKSKQITIKAVGDMSITGNVTGQVPQAQRLPGLNTIASRAVRFLDFLTQATASSNLIEWVYQANKDGAAGQTAEAALKNQIDFDILVGSQKIEKTTAFIRVTDEMLNDIDFMATQINNELTRELLKKVEAGAYSGNGTTPNLNGVRTVATAFSAGTFATAIDNANEVDVLTVAINQIMIAEQGTPNAIFMHPSDVTALKMVKVSSTDKRYVERLAMVAGELSLDGVPIVPTTLVTAGEYLVGDFTRAYLFNKDGGIKIEIGYNNDDFTKNFKTIRCEWRGAVVVMNNDRTAFVKGVFATDKAALETP